MRKNLFTSFVTWVFAMQAFLLIPAQARQNSEEARKSIEQTIANYNAFAANPNKIDSPAYLPAESIKYIKGYMEKNNFNSQLPKATLNKDGSFGLTMEGQSLLLNIDPVLGIIRVNGNTLVLKSGDDFKSRLEKIKKILTAPKTALNTKKVRNKNELTKRTVESFFSLIVSNAEADCLSKYNQAIKSQMPERDGIHLAAHPELWAFGIWAVYVAVVIGTAGGAMVPFALGGGTAGMIWTVADEKELKGKEAVVKQKLSEFIAIEGALSLAKTGKIPPKDSTADRQYTENEIRFLYLYKEYSSFVKKADGVPLSQEDFLKALAEGDANEKFCSKDQIDNAIAIAEKIMLPTIDPNIVNKSVEPTITVVDESRQDGPKSVDAVEVDKTNETSNAVSR